MENVATAMVGEERLTGNTTVKSFSELGNFEKYTLIGYPLAGVAVELESAVVAVTPGPEVTVCCGVDVTGGVDAPVVVGVGVAPVLASQAERRRVNTRKSVLISGLEMMVRHDEWVRAVEAFLA